MSSDRYRIEVLYFLNPHLIWVEIIDLSTAREKSFIFEQIGLYGVLPLEPFLDIVEENLQTRKTDEWVPAASVTIKHALSEAQEVWFSPTYIDRRSSLFDDNIHKYGEILIKKANGKMYQLSEILLKSGLAIYDMCLFHKELEKNNLKTNLQSFEAQDVIENIENFYKKKATLKSKWEKSVKSNTVIARTALQLESTLTEMNLEIHNKQLMSQLLQNKIKDFEMCKGIDEEPIGRACKVNHRSGNNNIASSDAISSECTETEHKSKILKRKLSLMGTRNVNSYCLDIRNENDTKLILADTKEFLERNAYNNDENDDITVRNQMSTVSQNNRSTNLISIENNDALSSNLTCIHNYQKCPVVTNCNKTAMKQGGAIKRANIPKTIEKRVTYGPPGISPVKLPYKIMAQSEYDQEQTKFSDENDEYIANKEDIYENVDSNISIEITNKQFLMKINDGIKDEQNVVPVSKMSCNVLKNEASESYKHCDSNYPCYNDSSSDHGINSSNSKVLKRKLMLTQGKFAKAVNSSCTSCSDTTNKDSSSSVEEIKIKQKEKRKEDRGKDNHSDDDDMKEIVRKINEDYPLTNMSDKAHMPIALNNTNTYNGTFKNSINPLKNIDLSLSSFTDKVVSPVLMVHTKMNKRIEPIFKISDVHFNSHIHIVLKNMSIVQPMMLQTISWFCILRGYSTFMVSPLGSGKTMGYLPAVCRLVSDTCPDDNASVGPRCIIICATVKSVAEVEKMARMFLGVKEKVLSCFAGVEENFVTTSLLNGCDLLICTASFLVRLLQITDFGVDMRRLATVVLDDCERLAEVYGTEVKYILYRIKDSIKNRTNKELKIQYIIASRIWCDFMEPIAKRAPYSVVCIGALQECVLYSKANMSVNFVHQENKVDSVHKFLNELDLTKKIVIVCRNDEEVTTLRKALGKYNNPVFACDSSLNIQNLFGLSVSWDDYEDPLLGPVLLCCDDTLTHLKVTDAHYLLHYSLPHLFSAFCKRFSVLNDNYSSIFKDGSCNIKIKILLEQSNVQQLPKMINFIKRCTDNIPESLNKISDNVLAEKDKLKASKLVPICDNLLGLGYCADFWNCLSRHTVFKEYDESKEWVPKTGQITFKILHYHSAVLFSVRLLSNTVDGRERKFPQTYSILSLKMGMFYGKESNRKPHGIPKVGDICAVSVKQNFFVRCQVIKILSYYQRGNPNSVLVKLIDEEVLENTRDIYLYHLPEELKSIETHAIQVRLANIEPKDKDVTFSNLARDQLKKITDSHEDMFIRGQAIMTIGNCVFVDTLEACQELSSLNKIVVKHDFKRDLLEKHAAVNMKHMTNLKKLCEGKFDIVDEQAHNDLEDELSKQSTKILPSGTWAHLNSDDISLVFFASAISPHKFFVRLQKFEPCLTLLIKDIQKYVTENPEPLKDVTENDIVLAMFPDDEMFERARIETVIDENKVRCFFVDQGDWRDVYYQNLVPIKEEFIMKLPFQAIECRLVGVNPAGHEWTDFSTNWFCDKCYDNTNDGLKHLYVKYYYKEKAECTGGYKYGIVMIDTNSDVDVIINQLLIDNNLAQENINEIQYLNEFRDNHPVNCKSNSSESGNEDNDKKEHFAKCTKREVFESCTSSLQTLFTKPIRSVPLVDSDGEDSDGSERWYINMTDDLLKVFKPATTSTSNSNLQAVAMGKVNTEPNGKAEEMRPVIFPKMLLEPKCEVKELDSDDYTSPECSESVTASEKQIKTACDLDKTRKPKLIWRQNRNLVVIRINLIGLQKYNLTIQGRSLTFAATLSDADYAFDLELYGAIDVSKSSHCNKGQYVLVKLSKILNKNWLTLTKDGGIRKWIVYDVDSIDASSEEAVEEQNNITVLNAIKNIHNQDEAESEDDDFIDDISYREARYTVRYHK